MLLESCSRTQHHMSGVSVLFNREDFLLPCASNIKDPESGSPKNRRSYSIKEQGLKPLSCQPS